MSNNEQTIQLPHATEVAKFAAQPAEQTPKQEERPPMTAEEVAARDQKKLELLQIACDFLSNYILKEKAPGKIRYRHKLEKNDSYIFKYSSPGKQGVRTEKFSQIMVNQETGECKLLHARPQPHPREEWCFHILYVMNGFSHNKDRTFEKLGLTPVQDTIRQILEAKDYTVEFRWDKRGRCNVVSVSWPKPGELEIDVEQAVPVEE